MTGQREAAERQEQEQQREREAQQKAAREAGAQFLAWVGAPQFERVTSSVALSITAVDAFLEKVRELSSRSLVELQSYLWTHPGTFNRADGIMRYGRFGENGRFEENIGYNEAHVQAYRSRLIIAVREHFGPRDAAEYPAMVARAAAARRPPPLTGVTNGDAATERSDELGPGTPAQTPGDN